MAYKLAGLFDLSWPIFTLPSASPYLQPGHADHMSPLFFCDAGHMHKLILSTRRPCQCSDGGGLQELVAYGLFVAPFKPKLVYKNNIVALGDSQLSRIWGKAHGPHNIRLWPSVGRLSRKFIRWPPLVVK